MNTKKGILRTLWNLLVYGKENPEEEEKAPPITPKESLHMDFLDHYATKLTLEVRNLSHDQPIAVRCEISKHIKSFPCFPKSWIQFWQTEIPANNKGGVVTNRALIGGFCRIHVSLMGKKFNLKEFPIEKENFAYTITVDKEGNITVINTEINVNAFASINH